MSYTLGAAARTTGKSKATIHRAIKSGRLSAARTDRGGWLIEAAELQRVFPETGAATVPMRQSATGNGTAATTAPGSPETVALERLLAEREATIRDLRTRLDAAAELQRTTLALLTDQSRRPWWRRWFR
jgi:excisionase family DNA binding protein